MKAAPVVEALGQAGIAQRLIHTGQHYDREMSTVFFDELGMPAPDVNLGVGSGTHAEQTGRIMQAIEPVLMADRPAWLVVYGDVNSTIAAALTAAKLGIEVAHVEAGLRSYDRSMPEEINRVLTDSIADLLLTTSPEAEDNLRAEGATGRIDFVGNTMIDTLQRVLASGRVPKPELDQPYALVTLHRPSNVDDPTRFAAIVEQLAKVSQHVPILFPVHPRGRPALAAAGWVDSERMRATAPVGYLEFIGLQQAAGVVITDSGGIQEETTILDVACVTVRPNTERPITLSHGTNRLVEPDGIADAVTSVLDGSWTPPLHRPPLWDGHAALRIASIFSNAACG
jgi:UDP-N-acetylglucosamine 2-epimerase (non-hydrolysing)